MSPRRRAGDERGWVPYPREPRGPLWVFLRHRAELTAAVVATGAPIGVFFYRYAVTDALLVLAAQIGVLAFTDVRHLVFDQLRRLVVERRLRAVFRESGPCTRTGIVPTVVRSAVRLDRSIQVWVWCPAGVSVDDLARDREAIAEACFVDEVVVERHRRWPNVAVLTLIRARLGPPTA